MQLSKDESGTAYIYAEYLYCLKTSETRSNQQGNIVNLNV